jgi:hypothetical protein
VRILNLCLNAALEFETSRPTVAANLASGGCGWRLSAMNAPPRQRPRGAVARLPYERRLTEVEILIRARLATIVLPAR